MPHSSHSSICLRPFKNIDHNILLYNLSPSGIHGTAIQWFNRLSSVRISKHSSSPHNNYPYHPSGIILLNIYLLLIFEILHQWSAINYLLLTTQLQDHLTRSSLTPLLQHHHDLVISASTISSTSFFNRKLKYISYLKHFHHIPIWTTMA